MIIIKEKLDNELVYDTFKILVNKTLKNKVSNSAYRDTMCLFLKKDKVSNSDIEKFVTDVLTKEIDDLKMDDNYYISNYINAILMRENILKSLNKAKAIDRDINSKLNQFKSFLNSSPDFKEKFFPEYTDTQFEGIAETDDVKCFINEICDSFNIIQEKLGSIFNYPGIMYKEVKADIIRNLGVEVCPYCNFNSIPSSNSDSTDKILTEAELDHFFPQGKFKLLGFSYGNIVPSCKSCNALYKGEKVEDIINPRFEEFGDDVIFKISVYDEDFLEVYFQEEPRNFSSSDVESINIYLESQNEASEKIGRIKNSIKMFGLYTKYNSNETKRETLSYIRTVRQRGSEPYKNMMEKLAGKDLAEHVFNDLRGFDDNDYMNVKYSKLKIDVIQQYPF